MALRKVAVVATLVASAIAAANPVIPTPMGKIMGVLHEKSDVISYKGLPYAKPPVGKLRFADPQAYDTPYAAVYNATEFKSGCMATCPPGGFPRPTLMCTPTISEDCLFLNVFTPSNATPSKPLPVIFFIHGGNYEYGSGGVPIYDGQSLSKSQGVVVVTINYRLGIFGALYTGTVKGNFQTKDQRLAMQWVRDNIRYFGGNPDMVTISGQSAGAASVAAHLASPKSGGLFQRAIIVSNPFSLLAADPMTAIQLGQKVLGKLNCTMQGGELELACLQAAPAEAILALTGPTNYPLEPKLFLAMMMRWVPVVDADELPYQPLYALRHGHFNKVPVMFGTVANESVQFIRDLAPGPITPFEYNLLIDVVFGVQIANSVRKLYGEPPASQAKDARPFLSFVATDYIFYCANRYVGGGLTKHVPTYMWYYDYASPLNEWIFGRTMPYCVKNVCHAQDLSSIFFPYDYINAPAGMPQPPAADRKLAKTVQQAWGNFARSADPNPLPVPGVAFPAFNQKQNILVNYSVPSSSMLDGYHNDYCDMMDGFGYLRR